MYKYLVAVWTSKALKNGRSKVKTDYRGFNQLGDAQVYAEKAFNECKKTCDEYDVVIYQMTDF